MKIDYIKNGDYLIPNLTFENDLNLSKLNKYGLLRYNLLKEYMIIDYTELLLENKLQNHLEEVQDTATTMVDTIIIELTEKENVNEELKEKDHLEWAKAMKNIKNRAEEVVLKEIVLRKEV